VIYAGMAAEETLGDGGLPVKGVAIPDGGTAPVVMLWALDGDGIPTPVTTAMLTGGGGGGDTMTVVAVDIGNGSATTVDVTHNLATRDVVVTVRETASPWAVVYPEIQLLTTNSVRLTFLTAPTSNQYRVIVAGVAVP
jgi:hypothetical protein